MSNPTPFQPVVGRRLTGVDLDGLVGDLDSRLNNVRILPPGGSEHGFTLTCESCINCTSSCDCTITCRCDLTTGALW
jgi:hypothetical protein